MALYKIEKLPKYIRFGVYILMTFPLWYTSSTMYPAHFGKTVLFQIGIEILLILMFYYLLKSHKRLFHFRLLDWLILGFFISLFIASVFGVDFTRSFWGYQSRAQGLFTLLHFFGLYVLLRQFFGKQKYWKILLHSIVGVGVLSSLVAWIGPYMAVFDGVIIESSRLSGLVTNPIFFAAYLIIPTFFSFLLAMQENDNKYKSLLFFSGLVLLATLMATQVRGVLVALIFSIVIFWFGYLFIEKSKKIRTIMLSIGIVLVCLGVSLYFFNIYSDTLYNNAPKVSRILDISLNTGTGRTRLMAWDIAYEGFKDRPVFGWGPENYQNIFDIYYNPDFLEFSLEETLWDKPHNYVMELLSTGGIVTTVFYLAILISLLGYLISLIKKSSSKNQKIIYLIIITAILFYLVQNLFGIETSYSYQLWFVLMAYIMFEYISKKEQEVTDKTYFYKKSAPIFLIIFFIITPIFLFQNINMYRASIYMGNARDAAVVGDANLWVTQAKSVLDVPTPFLWEQGIFLVQDISLLSEQRVLSKDILQEVEDSLVNIFLSYLNSVPDSFRINLFFGEFYAFMGEYVDLSYMEKSDEYMIKAQSISPLNQRVSFLLSKNYLLEGEINEALSILYELVLTYPTSFEVHWFYGLMLVEAGDLDNGIIELEKGSGFGFRHSGNIEFMIDLYAKQGDYDKIIPLYENLISEDINNGSLYARLAATYAVLGDTNNMIESINSAVEKDPSLQTEAKIFLEQQGISF
ncbi:hypothetical protein HOF40_02735 [Candidatus Parcubacteria bacterium]|jgi:O-antigen ligase|nr:hypothetical protein [Candidatus Parcubacteria bacterium]MBT3948981.1 hypothetical protein [Candidatus Parcubacteria bacterium]